MLCCNQRTCNQAMPHPWAWRCCCAPWRLGRFASVTCQPWRLYRAEHPVDPRKLNMHPGDDDFSMECPFPIFSSHVGFQGIHNSSIVQFAKYHFRKMSHPRVSLHDHSGCYSAIHFAYPQDHRRMDETKHLMPDFRLNKEGGPALKFERG